MAAIVTWSSEAWPDVGQVKVGNTMLPTSTFPVRVPSNLSGSLMHSDTAGSVAETAEPLCANVTVTGPEQPPPPSSSCQITFAVPVHVPASLAAGDIDVGVVGVVELPDSQATTASPTSATRAPAWNRRGMETGDRMGEAPSAASLGRDKGA
jgi:hypothetical protein